MADSSYGVLTYMIHSEKLTPLGEVYRIVVVPGERAHANPFWLDNYDETHFRSQDTAAMDCRRTGNRRI
jgi:hypothetical protein